MLVIKMLKRISGLNNQELATMLGKSRNTIASWELDESTIPETEKRRLNKDFNILPHFWKIGLNEKDEVYQNMYDSIKEGYKNYISNIEKEDLDPIERIFDVCENNILKSGDNEVKHYLYIQSLYNKIDPITGRKLDVNHFANDKKIESDLKSLYIDLEPIFNSNDNMDYEEYYYYLLDKLKKWRMYKAYENNVKAFQIVSDKVLSDIVKNFIEYDDPFANRIKNFPQDGLNYKLYSHEIKKVLEGEENVY